MGAVFVATRVESITEIKERKKTRDRLKRMIGSLSDLERDYKEMVDANMNLLMRLERQRIKRMLDALTNSHPDGD
jgi:hypothetical protein